MQASTLAILAIVFSTGPLLPAQSPNKLAAVSRPSSPRTPYYVVIDPGHGGASAPGARSSEWPSTVSESRVALAVALRVRRILLAQGIPVRMTRTSERENPSFFFRAAQCAAQCAALVSIHVNAMPTSPHPSRGLEAYIPSTPRGAEAALPLAHKITKEIQRYTRQPVLRIQPRDLAVLRMSAAPSVLLEIGFATHPKEGPWLLQSRSQGQIAMGIANAIKASLLAGAIPSDGSPSRSLRRTPPRPVPASRVG